MSDVIRYESGVPPSEQLRARVVTLHSQGLSDRLIGEIIECPNTSLRQIFHAELGLPVPEDTPTITNGIKGKPPFQPTEENRKTVRALAAYGVTRDDICKVIGIGSKHTLYAHFREELDIAAIEANSKVAQALFKRAVDPEGGSGAVTAAIFWMKARAGWKDTSGVEITGKDGGPLQSVGVSTNDPVEAARIYQQLMAEK